MKYLGVLDIEKNANCEMMFDLLVLSEKRKNLILLLREGSKTLSEIKDSLKVTSSGIIPQIRKMEEKQLIYQMDRKYSLTEVGNILAEYYCKLEEIIRIFGDNRKFWSEHKISAIPEEFRLRLHELGSYEIIRSTPTDIFRPHKDYMKNLLNARWMKAVSSVLPPRYPEYVMEMAERGIPVSIIVTRELLEKIKEEYTEELERGMGYKNTCVMVCNEKIELAFTATDFFLSMGLFLKDGTYDFYQNLMSFEDSAVRWGEDLFRYYEKRSKKVRLENL